MKRLAISTLFMAIICLAAGASAVDEHLDSLSHSRQFITTGGQTLSRAEADSLTRVIYGFYYNQFRHSQDPDAPYFMFISKEANVMMGIGGVVRMRGWYDWGGAIPANGFAPALIPIPADPARSRHLGTSPSGTSLYFRLIGTNKVLGEYQLYIEANFNGYSSRDFKLKKAYAQLHDFTVGYAPSTFSDPAAIPPTVDAQGPSNKISPTAVLVRWMPQFGKWSLAISAETPDGVISVDDTFTAKSSQWLPDGAAFVQYGWASGQHIRLAGAVRGLSYRDLVAQRNRTVAGWGLQLSSVAHPWHPVTTYLSACYGHGIGSITNDLMVVTSDLEADNNTPGRLYATAGWGYCAGVQYNFTPDLFCSAQFSQTTLQKKSGHQLPDDYKYGWCASANIFWNPTPRLQLGAEIDFAKRENQSGAHRYARRAGALVQFSF